MTKAAVTKLDSNSTVLYVSKPIETYLSGIIPNDIGLNVLDYNEQETKTKLEGYIQSVFNSYSPVEEILELNNYTIRLSGHCFDGEYAIIYWTDITDLSLKEKFENPPALISDDILIENTLKRFTNNLPLVVFEIFLFPDGRFEFGFVNNEMNTFFPEFDRDAVNADNSLLFVRVHPEDKEMLLNSIRNVFQLHIWEVEYRIIKNGEIRWVKGYGRPEIGIDPNENIIRVCAYIEDITQSKEASKQLKLVDFSFRNAAAPTIYIKKDGSFFDFNHATCKLLGYSRKEFEKLTILDINPNYNLIAWEKRWDEIKTGIDTSRIIKLMRKDGILIDIEARANIIQYGNLEINCTFYKDITEKKKLEQRLGLVNFLFEKTNVAIIIANEDSTLFDFNEAALTLHGYTREEMQKFRVGNLLSHEEESWEEAYSQVWNCLKEHKIFETVAQHKRKDGSIIDIEIRANYIKYGDMELNCSFILDITEKRKNEREIKQMNERYENALIATSDVIWETDLNSDLLFMSNNFTTVFGHELKNDGVEPGGMSNIWWQNIHPDDYDRAIKFEKEVISGIIGDKWESEYRFRKADGTYALVNDRGFAVKDENGKIVRWIGAMHDVTEKKKIEEDLLRSNQRYEYATLATSDVIWETDVVNDALYLGNNFTSVFGHETTGIEYGPDNIWRKHVHKDDLQFVLQQEADIILGLKDKWESEYRFFKADKTQAIILDRGFGVKDNSGKVVRLIGAMQDITEKKKIAEDLLRSNKRYEYATLATSDVVWETDLENKTLFLSNNFTLIFGHRTNGLEPMDDNIWRQNVHPDDLLRFQQSEAEALKNGQDKWQGEYRMRKADGTYAIILDRSFVIRNEAGEVIRLIGSMEDITLKRREEERLKLFETVIFNTTEAIIIQETKKNNRTELPIVYVNEAFTKMTGYQLDEIKGKSLKFLSGPLTQKEEQAKLRQAINHFQSGSNEVINYKKNGEAFWASISIFPVINNEGKYTHWVSIQRDITVKKDAEKEREKLLGELLISNKELRQFSYITTHNLRAPLTNLISICRLLNTTNIQDLNTLRLINAFKTSTNHLNDTLNDLINILIIKENPNIPVEQQNLKIVFDKVIHSISNTVINMKATLDVDFSGAETVNFNNAYLESILLNLLTNSLKYSHPERCPSLKIRTLKTKEGKIQLIFSDNGIGMNMARVKERIFGLYQRFHDNADSKGIGLYLIHSQITALGGTIEVTSEVNVGTVFTITFKK